MNIKDSINEIRRRLGFINPNSKGDVEWLLARIVDKNKEVFDALA